VIVAVTAETGAAGSSPWALKVLAGAATKIKLGNLEEEDTRQLLRSVFGAVPHVEMLAHKLHAVSGGNPRDEMQLAQHLVDRGVVRYKAGAWSLPANVDQGDLPENMAQALRARIDTLSADALELGRAMSLCPERGVTLDECAGLTELDSPARVLAALDQLLQAQVVSFGGETYAIARRGWLAALQADMAESVARRLHVALAEMFARRGDEGFRVAQHLLRAGETERGLDALVAHAEHSQKVTDDDAEAFFKLLQSMPPDWFRCYEDAIALCEALGRPRRHAFTLRSRLAGIMGATGIGDTAPLLALIEHLAGESGLRDWHTLDPAMEAMPRLVKALELTQARYAASSDDERVLEPIHAIRQLARAVLQAVGVVATTLDHSLWRALPSLAPLEPLSPALMIVSMLARGTGARTTARIEEARAVYDKLLERAAQADRAGLDETHHRYMTLGVKCGLGMIEASIGLQSSLGWASAIQSEPMHHVNALLIRMLYHLWQGELREADLFREQVDRLRIQSTSKQFFEGTHLLGQIVACAAADDLTRTKQTLDEIEVLAERHRDWVPVRRYAQGEYHRIRGDHDGALREFDAALASIAAGCHQLWPNIAGARARALLDLGRHEDARDAARASLQAAQDAGLGYVCSFVRMPLALALAKLGDAEQAVAHAQAAIDAIAAIGSKGLLLALAYETRACVATHLRDQAGFARHVTLCAEQLRPGSSRLLTAKYEKLKLVARRAELRVEPGLMETAPQTEQLTASQLTSLLDGCRGLHERARQSLAILLRQSGSTEGFLFTLGERGPELVARHGACEAPSDLAIVVRDYLDMELRDEDVQTATLAGEDEATGALATECSGAHGERFRLVLLTHETAEGHAITGVAAALVSPGKAFTYPGPTATQLSRLLLDSGDVVPAIVPD
jgi:tetratricopeptide (TPR) repeat protein